MPPPSGPDFDVDMSHDFLISEARSLVKQVVDNTNEKYGFGTLSCTVYDSAWVALVTKPISGQKHWLFPESFQYILSTQDGNGSWSDDTGAQVDGVLNTMAGLLVLKRYRKEPLQVPIDASDLDNRVSLATSALDFRLTKWDVSTTNTVGFEVIVPAMLFLLEKEDPSLVFNFKGKDLLTKAYSAKMKKFVPELIYSRKLMTLTHSLEALVGQIDFDKLDKHTVMGSMFASPSSTAAYLINATEWNDEAEDYLRHAVNGSIGEGSGGVPGVFPTTTFEYTWFLSTLLRAGFTPAELASPELISIKNRLLSTFHSANGAVGLAPGIEPDMDDSAKIVTTLNMLGTPISAQRLCEIYETPTHFRVYPLERDASFSANCNALQALLGQHEVQKFSSQIDKIARFLCHKQWEADEKIEDKWNVSHLYSSFLYAEAMVDFVAMSEKGLLPAVNDKVLLTKTLVTLFQICLRTMLRQEKDGSWGHSFEETAYAVLMLAEARRLCFFNDIRKELEDSIGRGVMSLASTSTVPIQYIWSDKVSYGSPSLTKTYILAARKAASKRSEDDGTVGSSIWQPKTSMIVGEQMELFKRTPLFKSVPDWELQASLIEGMIYQPLLHQPQFEIIQRKQVVAGKYLMLIPATWTTCTNRARTYASASYLWEMMALSFYTYQIDEFMEAIAGPAFKDQMHALHQIIDKVTGQDRKQLASSDTMYNDHSSGNGQTDSNGYEDQNGHSSVPDQEALATQLSRAADFILDNPIILQASPYDQNTLRQELAVFLHAHATQVEDNLKHSKEQLQVDKVVSDHSTPFFRWVRTTSADHIAGAFCFFYSVALMGATLTFKTTPDCFPTAKEKYLAAATCGHLSSMCRMYNDLGSWTRDRDEGNVNCIHFPEFGGLSTSDEDKKKTLFEIAQFDRARWNSALAELDGTMQESAEDAAAERLARRRLAITSMFCDVTDLYGQIYVVKDISAPIKDEVRNG